MVVLMMHNSLALGRSKVRARRRMLLGSPDGASASSTRDFLQRSARVMADITLAGELLPPRSRLAVVHQEVREA